MPSNSQAKVRSCSRIALSDADDDFFEIATTATTGTTATAIASSIQSVSSISTGSMSASTAAPSHVEVEEALAVLRDYVGNAGNAASLKQFNFLSGTLRSQRLQKAGSAKQSSMYDYFC